MSVEEESAWIDGWNELDEEVNKNPDLIFATSGWQEISQDNALGFIQDEAHLGHHVVCKEIWFKGKKALQRIYAANPYQVLFSQIKTIENAMS